MVLVTVCNEVCKVKVNSTNRCIDNGAIKHVTNCLDLFVDFQTFKTPCNVKVAGKETCKAVDQGSVRVLSKVDEKIEELILKDVRYVPNITKNLFSILVAQDKNPLSTLFSTTTKCWLKAD
ncbi:Hypothetical protein CINCED_3A013821 [Cinara cedri]|uniref:Retrovirus-related Pol polyprotein from transposon TNT 1-94-like beta-barrel domain-containing protein n=1 Tax=Cinara cedri TaxID=506608 RepID=A0A5E4NBY5_9HEMI|nr:Hypothetical protein CINCED_3A013821 [Cinara cedri]